MVQRSDLLVTADELAVELSGAHPPVVLDVRWKLDQPDGWDEYIAWHIHRAVYVRLDSELADPLQPLSAGRHPLPKIEDLQEAARGWGVRKDSRVVVYDDDLGLSAARAWWLLRHAGLADVRLLDGSMQAWTGAGLPLDTGVFIPERGDVVLHYGSLPVLDIDGAAAYPEQGILLDVRSPERYSGEVDPIDPVAGHIPGAVNAPTIGNLDEHGLLLPVAELRERFEALGVVGEAAAYCGSGVASTHTILALQLAGFVGRLYPGSWSEWSNHPDRPVEIGDPVE